MITDPLAWWQSAPAPQKRATMFGAVALAGWLFDSKWAMTIGAGGLISGLVDHWSDQQLTKNPDTMNGFFKTGGALSGARSDAEARRIRRLQRQQQSEGDEE